MKTFAIILVLGFTSQVSHAFFPTDVEKCTVENGFTNSEADLSLIDAVGDPQEAHRLNNVPKEKLAAAVACMFSKEYRNTLYDMLRILIDMDDKATKDQRLQMIDTLNACNTQAKGNDAELLICVKAFEAPFDYLLATLHMFGKSAIYPCYGHCGMKIPDLYTLEDKRNHIDELLKRFPLDNMYCAAACRLERTANKDNPLLVFYNMLTEVIDKSMSEDKKAEAKATVEKCYTAGDYKKVEVTGSLDETIPKGSKVRDAYQLMKCIKFFEEPLLSVMRH